MRVNSYISFGQNKDEEKRKSCAAWQQEKGLRHAVSKINRAVCNKIAKEDSKKCSIQAEIDR